jgi:TolB protein
MWNRPFHPMVNTLSSNRDCEPAPDEETHCLSLYIVDVDGSNLTRLTNGDDNNVGPTWSPDGSHIAFHRDCDLAIINPDGSNLWLWQSDVCIENPAWSPDGQRLAFGGFFTSAFPDDQHRDIYIINSDGTNLVKLARFEAPGGVKTIWSPDGQKIGVQIDEHEKFGVHPYYLLNADGSGEPVEVESIPHSWYHWYWPQWGNGG